MDYKKDFKIEGDTKQENVWERKDRRIARMNVLSTAVKIIELSIQSRQPELTTGDNVTNEGLKADKLADLAVILARKLERYIYE